MKSSAYLLAWLLLLPCRGSSQIEDSSLVAAFGKPVDNVFTIGPKLKLKADYGSDGRACVLTISGLASEDEVKRAFDTVVPEKSRGAQKLSMTACTGGCHQSIVYERVTFSSSVMGNWQTSEPAAIVTFTRDACKVLAAEANNVTFITQFRKR